MALKVESFVDGGVRAEKTLGGATRARRRPRSVPVKRPHGLGRARSCHHLIGIELKSRVLQFPGKVYLHAHVTALSPEPAGASGRRLADATGTRKFVDSPLEEDGFELLVRGRGEVGCRAL